MRQPLFFLLLLIYSVRGAGISRNSAATEELEEERGESRNSIGKETNSGEIEKSQVFLQIFK